MGDRDITYVILLRGARLYGRECGVRGSGGRLGGCRHGGEDNGCSNI
jgi:hypothetical protein